MTGRRPIILLGILLVLLLGYLASDPRFNYFLQRGPVQAAPLAGKNTVSGLDVSQDKSGIWKLNFDYFYTGAPQHGVVLRVELDPLPASAKNDQTGYAYGTYIPPPQRGSHHVSHPIGWPGFEGRTEHVTVSMVALYPPNSPPLSSQRIEKTIDWPTWQTWAQNEEFAKKTPAQNLQQAVTLIDLEQSDQLNAAKLILERLISQDAKFDPAYVELARIAMKSNWGPEGLHQAENLLSSALQIRPDSVDAKILLGYVYSN
jgi:hypothetical protein